MFPLWTTNFIDQIIPNLTFSTVKVFSVEIRAALPDFLNFITSVMFEKMIFRANLKFFNRYVVVCNRDGTPGLIVVLYLVTICDWIRLADEIIVIIRHLSCQAASGIIHDLKSNTTLSTNPLSVAS